MAEALQAGEHEGETYDEKLGGWVDNAEYQRIQDRQAERAAAEQQAATTAGSAALGEVKHQN